MGDFLMGNLSGFPHFMLQEIYEQPEVLRNCLANYFSDSFLADPSSPHSCLSDPPLLAACPSIGHYQHFYTSSLFTLPPHLLIDLSEIHIIACGTSRHAALIGQYWLEQIAAIPTRIRSGSEFQEAPLPLNPNTLTIGVTQSGETADTLAAVRVDRERRSLQSPPFQPRMLGITNHPTSSLATLVDGILPTLAGTEIGVAATKTLVTQLAVFFCLVLALAKRRHLITVDYEQRLVSALHQLPTKIQTILEQEKTIRQLAQWFLEAQSCIILGRGINRAIALEAALKFKETSYLHAEGYAAGEFMHGPIALLDARVPVIAIAPTDSTYPAIVANVQKAKTHHAPILGIITANNAQADHAQTLDHAQASNPLFDHQLVLPTIDPLLSPFLTIIPLQLLAYHIAVQRGINVDQPRNITKTLF
jgi:glucosamine--fructose-6-phosphate aminotransferase (isomerizing)